MRSRPLRCSRSLGVDGHLGHAVPATVGRRAPRRSLPPPAPALPAAVHRRRLPGHRPVPAAVPRPTPGRFRPLAPAPPGAVRCGRPGVADARLRRRVGRNGCRRRLGIAGVFAGAPDVGGSSARPRAPRAWRDRRAESSPSAPSAGRWRRRLASDAVAVAADAAGAGPPGRPRVATAEPAPGRGSRRARAVDGDGGRGAGIRSRTWRSSVGIGLRTFPFMTRVPRAASAVGSQGSCRRRPQDPLVRSAEAPFPERIAERDDQFGGAQASRVGCRARRRASMPARRWVPTTSTPMQQYGRAEVVGDLLALAGSGEDQGVGSHGPGDEQGGGRHVDAGRLDLPGAGFDRLLQRRGPRLEWGHGGDVDADRQRSRVEALGSRPPRSRSSSSLPASSRSRYSASDSAPVGRASPKAILGRGEKPWE